MEDDEKYLPSFDLIMNAGNSRSAALRAIELARNFEFEEAERLLKDAENSMRLAHKSQTGLLQQEAMGNPIEMHIVLVHAQDHMTMAIMAIDEAREFIYLYRLIEKMLKK